MLKYHLLPKKKSGRMLQGLKPNAERDSTVKEICCEPKVIAFFVPTLSILKEVSVSASLAEDVSGTFP